jgi:hypothetical protein
VPDPRNCTIDYNYFSLVFLLHVLTFTRPSCLCIYLPADARVKVETCRRSVSDKRLFNIDCAVCWIKYHVIKRSFCLEFMHLWKIVFVSDLLSVLKLADRFLHLVWEVSNNSYGTVLTSLYWTKIRSTLLIAISGPFHVYDNWLITFHIETTGKP